jgi:hypothetical protein
LAVLSSQIASKVLKRIALGFPVFKIERSDNSINSLSGNVISKCKIVLPDNDEHEFIPVVEAPES